MGRIVTVNSRHDSKPSYTSASIVGATLTTPLAGEMSVFVGNDVIPLDKVEIWTTFERCRDALNSLGWPLNVAFASAEAQPGGNKVLGAGGIVFVTGIAVPVLTEADVAIIYTQSFSAATDFSAGSKGPSQIFGGHAERAMERILEEQLKAA